MALFLSLLRLHSALPEFVSVGHGEHCCCSGLLLKCRLLVSPAGLVCAHKFLDPAKKKQAGLAQGVETIQR